MFKKLLISLTLLSALLTGIPSVSAAATLLPSAGTDAAWCDPTDSEFVTIFQDVTNSFDFTSYINEHGAEALGEYLGCAMKLGLVKFWMIPYFVIYALNFAIQLAGLITVLMIVVGGYYYIAGGITDDKEKGKHIITYALGGFVLVLTSWFIVNTLLLALTS